VPADGGLRQLQHGAEFRHGQFVPLERQEHADADRVREGGHVVQDGRGHRIHPYIRMKA
jgi:hypothetical protein